jgi:hypothetical protein
VHLQELVSNWWQDEWFGSWGRCDAASYRASWITRQIVGLGSSKDEKPAFHIRRMWVLDERALDEGFVREIAGEVERLLVDP